jgi:hypothetical protein
VVVILVRLSREDRHFLVTEVGLDRNVAGHRCLVDLPRLVERVTGLPKLVKHLPRLIWSAQKHSRLVLALGNSVALRHLVVSFEGALHVGLADVRGAFTVNVVVCLQQSTTAPHFIQIIRSRRVLRLLQVFTVVLGYLLKLVVVTLVDVHRSREPVSSVVCLLAVSAAIAWNEVLFNDGLGHRWVVRIVKRVHSFSRVVRHDIFRSEERLHFCQLIQPVFAGHC